MEINFSICNPQFVCKILRDDQLYLLKFLTPMQLLKVQDPKVAKLALDLNQCGPWQYLHPALKEVL